MSDPLPWRERVALVKQALDAELSRGGEFPKTTRELAASIARRIDTTPSVVARHLMKLAPSVPEAFKGPAPFVSYGKAIYPWLWGPRAAVQADPWTIEPEALPEHEGLWVGVLDDLGVYELDQPNPDAATLADMLEAQAKILRRTIA